MTYISVRYNFRFLKGSGFSYRVRCYPEKIAEEKKSGEADVELSSRLRHYRCEKKVSNEMKSSMTFLKERSIIGFSVFQLFALPSIPSSLRITRRFGSIERSV